MKAKVRCFFIQATPSFPDGAPQREEYEDDASHNAACRIYANEWREHYECMDAACRNRDCPQHSPEPTPQTEVAR